MQLANHHQQKKKENKGLLISKTIIIFSQMYGNYQISF